MDESYCPTFLIPDESDPENPHPVRLPQPDEETIFPLQINVGLRFPYCSDLVEMCKYYAISPAQLSPNTLRVWVGFCFVLSTT